ncbi:Oleosin protein [Dioscorea alata]|uniref:Oleosin protein n=1 Tax=Dioscorea alata TaxID=55571 RepID=A0ACB7UBC6_DIOAL|nr:Oleosin protein [Dioscorea alata]
MAEKQHIYAKREITTPWTRTRQTFKFITAGATGVALLLLAGLTATVTVLSLVMATPVMVIFSPVLVPAGVVLFLGLGGLVLSCGLGVAALAALLWIYNYVAGKKPPESEQVEVGVPAFYLENTT